MRPGNAMGVVGGTGGSLDGPVHGSWKQTGPPHNSTAVGDLNGINEPDLVVANASDDVSVLLN